MKLIAEVAMGMFSGLVAFIALILVIAKIDRKRSLKAAREMEREYMAKEGQRAH